MHIFASQVLPKEMTATQSNDDTGSGTNGATSNSATITANDFLQLLVTEMKNQDPTTQTDPNEYIDQLVQVNSLEQLIQINQDLGADSTTGAATGDTAAAPASGTAPTVAAATTGNLSAGPRSSAAVRVMSALGGDVGPASPLPASDAAATTGNSFDAIVAAMRSRAAAQPTNPAR